MPISALVLALSPEPLEQRSALDALARDARVTVGQQERNILPIVVETESVAAGIEIVTNELPALAGIQFVHVVSVDFSDADYSLAENRLKTRTRRGGKS